MSQGWVMSCSSCSPAVPLFMPEGFAVLTLDPGISQGSPPKW